MMRTTLVPVITSARRAIPLIFSLLLFSLATHSRPADAVIGGQIFASGTNVVVQILMPESAATSDIWLASPRRIFIGTSREVGKTVFLGRYAPGTELIFAIRVHGTGWTFFTGPGTRNPDGIPHADVVPDGPGFLEVRW
jgi:hypothetical protein